MKEVLVYSTVTVMIFLEVLFYDFINIKTMVNYRTTKLSSTRFNEIDFVIL